MVAEEGWQCLQGDVIQGQKEGFAKKQLSKFFSWRGLANAPLPTKTRDSRKRFMMFHGGLTPGVSLGEMWGAFRPHDVVSGVLGVWRLTGL